MGSARSGTTRRRASVAASWSFWRHVGGPILAPAFLGALLLLFTNAFSAYATAAALISQGARSSPSRSRGAMQSEVVLGQENVGKALALGMILVVSLAMLLYAFDPAARVAVGAMTCDPGAPLSAAAPQGGALPRDRRARPRPTADRAGQLSVRIAILVVVFGYLILPLFAMLEFSTRGDYGSRTLDSYAAIFGNQDLVDGVDDVARDRRPDRRRACSLLLVPTMVWTSSGCPRMRRVVEFLCLLAARHPGDRHRRRHRPDLSLDGPEPRGDRRVAADPRPHRHHPRAAVRLPRHRCKPSLDRHGHARRRRPQPGRGLAPDDPPGDRAEHPGRDPVGLGPGDRAGPRRVHDLVAACPSTPSRS